MLHTLKTAAAAASLVAFLPFAASAVTINAGQSYTEVGTLMPGGQLVFTFDVAENLDIDFFSISATGTNGGDDIDNVTFDYYNVTDDTFDNVFGMGNAGAGFDFVPGFGPYKAGDTFSFTFKDGIKDEVGITISFETAVAAVPVPAAGGMLGLPLVGAGVAARRRKRAA